MRKVVRLSICVGSVVHELWGSLAANGLSRRRGGFWTAALTLDPCQSEHAQAGCCMRAVHVPKTLYESSCIIASYQASEVLQAFQVGR